MANRLPVHECCYEIQVRGHLDAYWMDWLGEGAQIANREDGTALISGVAHDSAVLYGVLNRIRDFNLELLIVRQVKVQPV